MTAQRMGGARHTGELVRGLSLVGAFSVVVGTMIGTGVFLKARVMICNVETPLQVLAVWVVAGLLSLAGALTYAELAAMMPEAGGEYVFIREAYGPFAGYLYGWTQSAICYSGSAAAKAAAFAIFANVLLRGALEGSLWEVRLAGLTLAFGPLHAVALAIVVLVTVVNFAAVAASGRITAALTLLKMALVLGVGVGAFVLAPGDWGHFLASGAAGSCEGVSAAARGGLAGFGAAMLGALWAYDGWSTVSIMAGEVRRPERTLPRALVVGVLSVMLLYVFVNASYFAALAPEAVASVPAASAVATEVVARFLGRMAVAVMAAGMMLSTLGSLYNGILTGARIPFAMARDGNFVAALARVSPRTRVPVRALVVQGVWVSVLVLSGSFDALTDYAMFAAWIFYGLAASTVFVFRRRLPAARRPFATPGYPVVPLLFLLVTGFLLVNTVITSPTGSLAGLALIALGVPLYRVFGTARR